MSGAISNAQRAALRRAIASHPDWPAYRRTHGVDTASLGAARAVDVARHLGLDVETLIGAAAPALNEEHTPMQHFPAPAAPAGLFDRRTPAAPVAAAPAGDVGAALATLAAAFGGAGNVQPMLDALAARIDALESAAPRLLVVDRDGKPFGGELPAQRHPMLETLVRCLGARDAAGRRLNVWISGPTGSGKTHGARQAADALGLAWGFHGAMSMAHELLGFVDAGGTYHSTQFVERFRSDGNGGLCLLDELDSWGPEATLCLNAALANGQLVLPTGEIVDRHPDFACIGAGNTWGLGATAEFVGRNRLDAAFLSRFAVKLSWAYDPALEAAMCGNPDFAGRVQKARAAAGKHGVKAIVDPRASMAGAALIAAGFTADEAAAMTYLGGLSPEQATLIDGGR